jgi:hypothetical protein
MMRISSKAGSKLVRHYKNQGEHFRKSFFRLKPN